MRRLFCLFALTSACVPQARYDQALLAYSDAVQGRSDAVQGRSEEAESFAAERAAALAEAEELRSELATLTQDHARLTAMLDDRQAALQEAQATIVEAASDSGALQASVEEMQAALAEVERQRLRAEASSKAYDDLIARFQSLIDAGTLNVRVVNGRMLLQLATDILFTPGSATVSVDGSAALAEVAAILAEDAERQYQVAGHTDNVPIQTQRMPSNWYLGAARSIEVVNLLVANGVMPTNVSAASFSEYQPVADNDTPESRSQNRRIEIIVVPDLSDVPGFSELSSSNP